MRIKKIILEKLYILLIGFALVIYCYFMMISMNESDINQGEVAIPTLVVFMPPFIYILINYSYLQIKNKFVSVMLCLTIGIGIINIIMMPVAGGSYFKKIIFEFTRSFLPLTLFLYTYILFQKYEITNFFALIMSIVTVFVTLAYFTEYVRDNELKIDEYAHIGISYFSLFLLPICLLNKNKWVRLIMIVIVFLALFFSMKRGGIIALFLGLFSYFFINSICNNRQKKLSAIIIVFVSFAILIGVFFYLDNVTENYLSERIANIEEDQGSGRLDVWEETWHLIQTSDELSYLVGHGYNAVLRDSRMLLSAHNDFLEVFYDYGSIIFVFYLILHIRLIKMTLRLIKTRSFLAPAMAMSYVIMIILSMISHIIIYPWYCLFALYWGITVGIEQRELSIK
jgi:hypothetical protein